MNRNQRGFHILHRSWKNGDIVKLDFPMEPVLETRVTVNNGGITGNDDYGDGNRNNYVVGGLPYATVSLGPLLFALPLESNSDWQFALDTTSALQVVRNPTPSAKWNWPLDGPLKIIATAHDIQ